MLGPHVRPLSQPALWAALIAIGVAWGSTGLFSKMIVDAGYHPLGMLLAGTIIGAVIIAGALLATGRSLPLSRAHIVFYAVAGMMGTVLPHSTSYYGYQVLQVGVTAIIIAIVPILTFLAALVLRMDRAEPMRILGLALGCGAVALIVLPETSLPSRDQALWVVLPVIASLSYTVENIYIARSKPARLDPLQVLAGLFFAALVMMLPVVAVTGTWMPLGRFDAIEGALMAMTLAHLGAYGGFVWLIGRAGPVFAAQVGYVVTLTGVFLGVAVLDERHSSWIWLALAMMLAGLALVSPRQRPGPPGPSPQPSHS